MSASGFELASLDDDLQRLVAGRHHHPFGVLGPHRHGARTSVIACIPRARDVGIESTTGTLPMQRRPASDVFVWEGDSASIPPNYRLSWTDDHGHPHAEHDAYAFSPILATEELEAFAQGRHHAAWRLLGARPLTRDRVEGVQFSVWAPNAERVSVVGPFCAWDGRRFPMNNRGSSGVWELFVPGLPLGTLYKFEIRNRASGAVFLKSDPYATACEQRPATASRIMPASQFRWSDNHWLRKRAQRGWSNTPLSVYEVHLGSWRKREDGTVLSYRELADELIPYVQSVGFTHIELMPITEYPLDDSWGYQTTGYFAPTSRYGEPDDLRHFIDRCHAANIGVLLDWVPAHFPRDAHGLANFDGSALYEYADPRRAEHRDWGTLIFDYERHEVRSFLISSARYWLEEFHFDGLRVDAVASMLYLDFSRRKDDFVPNRHGGNHNLEAIDFLRELNAVVHADFPGATVIAEESTDWPLVTRPTHDGGLGFSMKWNMGWMHDTLSYFKEDPIFRAHHHDRLTFGMMYAYTENFVLPLSHDEVVHLKRSLLGRMPGDDWQRFANLRLLFTYMWTFPGKKLLFMGGELAQPGEWDFRTALPWHLLQDPKHSGVQRLLADLNRLYVSDSRLHRHEFDAHGFRWLDPNDRANSILTYSRSDGESELIVALNFTPVPREGHRLGVDRPGQYRELFNSDSAYYGGSNVGNGIPVASQSVSAQGRAHSVEVTLPPLGAIILAL